jgi:uncharacterized protein (TIRG00374 family)
VALGAYVLSRTDLRGLVGAASQANLALLGLTILLYVLDRFAAAHRWRILHAQGGSRIGILPAVSVYLQSGFLGAAIPSGMGGDVIRARLVAPDGGTFRHAISSVILERLLGTVALVLVAAVGLAAFGPRESWASAVPALVVGTAFVALGVALVLAPPVPARVLDRVGGAPRAILAFLLDVHERVRGYSRVPGVLALSFAIAVGQQVLLTGINWVLALALHIPITLTSMLWMWPIVMLAVRLPISIQGFGVREALLLGFFGSIGLPQEQAVVLGLLSGLLDLLFLGLGGLLWAAAPAGRILRDG